MRFRKLIALFLSIIMLMSFSTMFVSAATPRVIDYPKTWVNVGETLQLSLPSGATNATWSSSSNAIATVSSTGKVTGVSRGENLKISVRYTLNGSTVDDELYINVYDNRGIVNGEEYYIMNRETKQVLSLASYSTANNTVINTSARGISTTKQWKLTQQSTGKYTFVSMYNSTTKGMYANTSTNDVYLYTVGSSATHFEIERVNSGDYEGLYRIRYGTKYLSTDSTNDVFLTNTLSSRCYWSLSRTERYTSSLFSFNYTNSSGETTNTTAKDDEFISNTVVWGYYPTRYLNSNSLTAKNALLSSDIFVFRGHGATGVIGFYNSNGVNAGKLVANYNLTGGKPNYYDISSLVSEDDDGNEIYASMSSLRCVLYLGCSTGTGIATSNLVNVTYNKGAHFVFGTGRNMYTSNNNKWFGHFMDKISAGLSIGEAVDYANLNTAPMYCPIKLEDGTEGREYVTTFPAYFMGDVYQYLNGEG